MINIEHINETMEKIKKKLSQEKELLVKNSLSTEGVSEGDSIDNLMNKSSDASFKLLAMGQFSSGKSTFVNVLLGEKLLPEKAKPTTAIITEVYYGKEKKVIMFPKAGKWKGGNEPFEIEPTLSEIAKYSTINNKAGLNSGESNEANSCFEKMVVYWPLEMLKGGVSIIDSPGTNDPYANDYIVESYLPKADAILYCIGGTRAYDISDKNTLERITAKGYKDPIIVTTYFDVVTEGLNDDEMNEFVNETREQYANHTIKEYCHFVNSRLGLKAKQDHSQSELVESGYYELEKFLSKYLTEYKGKEKISSITSLVDTYNNNQIRLIDESIAGLDTPLDEFNRLIEEKNTILEQAKTHGKLLLEGFSKKISIKKDEVKNLIPGLYDRLYTDINLDGYEPGSSFTMWHPKDSKQQIADECQKEIEIRQKAIIESWCNEVLVPKIEEILESIKSSMNKNFSDFSNSITDVGTIMSSNNDYDPDVKPVTKVASFALGLLTGDVLTAMSGGVFGVAGAGRAFICQFVVGLFTVGVLGLVSFPALLISGVIGTLLGAGWSASKVTKSIKKGIVKAARENLSDNRSDIIEKATAASLKVFDQVEEQLEKAINDDIEEAEQNIQKVKKEREENANKIEERKKALSGVVGFLKETNKEMADIRKEFNI